ncbi:alpha/beta fold hydrolase [Nonomuraea sp. NPDC049419]|uniref:alpha/beta fold hydrolase n=1 Tax=Nonomuraea sp. NPDC049419 TaxID=3155772 RepID=UPI00342829DD
MPAIISADGTPIACTSVGTGPTVIYVGGAIMHRAIDACGSGMASRLSFRYTVVTYDRRGRGESGDSPPYAVRSEVEDIIALITRFGDTAMVFGESSGAVLALEAVLAGAPISRLALYEPPFIVDGAAAPMPAGFPVPEGISLQAARRAAGRADPGRLGPAPAAADRPTGRTFGETRRRVKVIGRFPSATSCVSLVWAVLDRAAHGWRGFTMTSRGLRTLQDLGRALFHPPTQLHPIDDPALAPVTEAA